MKEQIMYLDTSAIIKRYIREHGSDYVGKVYLSCYSGETVISFSLWNIGEVLGVLDKARIIGRIDSNEYSIVRKRFILESRRMMKLGALLVVPLKIGILKDSWKLIEKHHTNEADAIQMASAKYVKASLFLTGDKRLYEVSESEGLKSKYLG